MRITRLLMIWLLLAAPAAAVEIEIGQAAAAPGEEVVFDVTLHSQGAQVAGIQNDIEFDLTAPILSVDGGPDCWVNPAIDKGASAFAFLYRCSSESCGAMRAVILSLTDIDPIADGAVLYSCRMRVDAGPSVPHPLYCTNPGAGSPAGEALSTTCRDGGVLLGTSTVPTRTPSGTPTPVLREPGTSCDGDAGCRSGICDDGICCTRRCGADEVCNAAGGFPAGDCVPACASDGDCAVGEQCVARRCLSPGGHSQGGTDLLTPPAAPSPTPTLLPVADADCLDGSVLCSASSSDGSCAIVAPTAAPAWVLLAPLAIVVRRRRRLPHPCKRGR